MAGAFEQFWTMYPRKAAKGDARKAWGQMEELLPPITELLGILAEHKKCEQFLRDGGQYIPYPATWLRQERWEDELKVDMGSNVNGKEWHETASGIAAKALELGVSQRDAEPFPQFKARVFAASGRLSKAA